MPTPPSAHPWDDLAAALDRWAAAGRTARLWLRDDDAVEPTAALDRLVELTARFAVPVLLAVIPAKATEALGRRLAGEAGVLPCQHGFAHANHALPGEKAAELGPQRPRAVVLAELAEGHRRALDLFGDRLRPVLVPPWNRIAAELVPALPGLGFRALSTFGWQPEHPAAGIRAVNCHVDIIDWKGSRGAHPPAKVVGDLIEALDAASGSDAPVGILTHHLVHDAAAWSLLEDLFRATAGHAAVHWVPFDAL